MAILLKLHFSFNFTFFFRSQPECKVISTPDQDFTDFSKALKELCASQYIGLIDRVLVFVENTGRLDQIFANLETLCLVEKLLPRNLEENFKPVFLVSSSSLTWFMDHGKHKIKLPKTG